MVIMANWTVIFKANNDVAEVSRRDFANYKQGLIVYNEARARLSDEKNGYKVRLESCNVCLQDMASGKVFDGKTAETVAADIVELKAKIEDVETREKAVSEVWAPIKKKAFDTVPGAMYEAYRDNKPQNWAKEVKAWLAMLGFCPDSNHVPNQAVQFFKQIDKAGRLSAGKFCEVNNGKEWADIQTVRAKTASQFKEAIINLLVNADCAGAYLPGSKRCEYVTAKMVDAAAKKAAKEAKKTTAKKSATAKKTTAKKTTAKK